jgi:2-oxoglutarate dehydrogenase E2 component (dihydrolipoamide succinyltransferase)
MSLEIKIPSPGESITQVQLAKWLVNDGDIVDKDQEIIEIDSDKASFPIAAPESGTIKILTKEGETVSVGAVIATIESGEGSKVTHSPTHQLTNSQAELHASPLAKKIIEEKKVNVQEIQKAFPGKKITRKDIESFVSQKKEGPQLIRLQGSREEDRKKLTTLRLKLAERLVSVKNSTAMLTTFNEINMSTVLHIKAKHNEEFKDRFGTGIGFMSFFAKAVTLALQEYPQLNSMIDGDELVTPRFVDIGIAVSAPKGLIVPVVRNAETLGLAEMETKIKELAIKARDNRITIDDMKGGTFTITNGGVFGSLMSTPILNPPQSAILGMHKIQERPIALNGQVVIAPMMYVALSYDHRIIDGKESVGFLVKVKELIEDPMKMLTVGYDPMKLLLDL